MPDVDLSDFLSSIIFKTLAAACAVFGGSFLAVSIAINTMQNELAHISVLMQTREVADLRHSDLIAENIKMIALLEARILNGQKQADADRKVSYEILASLKEHRSVNH